MEGSGFSFKGHSGLLLQLLVKSAPDFVLRQLLQRRVVGSVRPVYIHIGHILSASGVIRWWKKVWNTRSPSRPCCTSFWSSAPITSSLFYRLEGPHDQLSRLSGLLPVNGGNGASALFLM